MASDAYQIIDANDTVVTSGTLVAQDAYEAVILTVPTGVSFAVVIVVNTATRNNAAALGQAIDGVARPYAGYVDAALALPEVVGLYGLQAPTPSLTVANQWVVTVASSSGNLTKELTIAFTDLIPDRLGPLVQQAQTDLDALEAQGA